MSMEEVRAELANEILEQKYRENKTREQARTAENIMRNEIQERTDDFENPHERSVRYFKMDEINANISREKERTSTEQNKNIHDTQTKEERGL